MKYELGHPEYKEPKATHRITFGKIGSPPTTQTAHGKTDLFNCLRGMMKDGYTDFKISTL